jgi:hypothetical protein
MVRVRVEGGGLWKVMLTREGGVKEGLVEVRGQW